MEILKINTAHFSAVTENASPYKNRLVVIPVMQKHMLKKGGEQKDPYLTKGPL